MGRCFSGSLLSVFINYITPTLQGTMTNHFCGLMLFCRPCDMDHESEANTYINKYIKQSMMYTCVTKLQMLIKAL